MARATARRASPEARTIALRASVVTYPKGARFSQLEACEAFGVSDRTLRLWVDRGMPSERGPGGRPVYPLPDAQIWVTVYQILIRQQRQGRAPAHLTLERARSMDLDFQARQWPEDFVLVPLDWDHPAREGQLRKAAAGVAPPAEEELEEGLPA